MTLQPLDRDLWVIDHALAMGGLSLGTRTTVLRLPDGSMALISPGPLDDAGAAAVTALGPVRALVAPNTMHHLWLADARRRFPDARLYAPPALAKKRPELPIDVALPASPAPDVLVPIAVAGMPRLDETAFVHRPSRTLVLTDLAFNLRPPAPWLTRQIMRLNGGFDRFGPTRLCRALIRDRPATRKSVDQLLGHDFDRIIVAHGQVLAGDGHAALRDSFAWLA